MNVDLVRDTAVNVLLRVFEHEAYLDIALDKALRRRALAERARRFLTQLVYGTVRHKLLCDFVLGPLLHQPLDSLPAPIRAILRMGVFQTLFCSQVTFPSMVHTSVDLAKRHGHAGTARLVNAVLRRVPQRLDDVRFPSRDADFAAHLSVCCSMPRWLVDTWVAQFGSEQAEVLCTASNIEAPHTIRTNTLKTSPEALLDALTKAGHVARKCSVVPEEITVDGPLPSMRSMLFREGHFFVQDAASMLPPHLLEPKPGQRVLDLCAAPGGKTTHLAQLTAGASRIVAMDIHAGRLRLIDENCARLGIEHVDLVCGDGVCPPFRAEFDRVLVDAPCTGLGTLRRHPDLKWRVGPEDPARLGQLQVALLRSAVRLCKNGGIIVYSVCTITPEETRDVVRAVLETEAVAPEPGPEWFNPWNVAQGQYQTLPASGAWDGFFLTRLRKPS